MLNMSRLSLLLAALSLSIPRLTSSFAPSLTTYCSKAQKKIVPSNHPQTRSNVSVLSRPQSLSVATKARAIADDGPVSAENKNLTPKITTVEQLEHFLDFLSEDGRLCIIKFHASWCKSCQKFGVRYKKLALQEGDKMGPDGALIEKGRVRFAEVEFNANARLCRTLGIKRLPYIHMYRGAQGRLTDFACGPNKFQLLVDTMNDYLDESDDAQFSKVMEQGDALGDNIVTELKREHYDRALNLEANFDAIKGALKKVLNAPSST